MTTEHSEERSRRQTALALRAARGDELARERLVRELLPVAERVARRFASPHHPLEDLAQVAGIGLLKAIERFDPAREAGFRTYAQALMTGEIRRHLRDARLLRVPRPIYELVPRFQREQARLTAVNGRRPTRAELAAALGLTKEELIEVADAAVSTQPVSLDGELALNGEPWEAAEEDEGFEQAEAGAALAPLLRRLSDRERMVLDLRFESGLAQSEIADGLGLSQAQVSRILRGALAKLARHAAPSLA